jgi:hypothetical protein
MCFDALVTAGEDGVKDNAGGSGAFAAEDDAEDGELCSSENSTTPKPIFS